MTPLTILLIAWTAAIVVGLLRSLSFATQAASVETTATRVPSAATPLPTRHSGDVVPTNAAAEAA